MPRRARVVGFRRVCFVDQTCRQLSVFNCSIILAFQRFMIERTVPLVNFLGNMLWFPFWRRRDKDLPSFPRPCPREILCDFSSRQGCRTRTLDISPWRGSTWLFFCLSEASRRAAPVLISSTRSSSSLRATLLFSLSRGASVHLEGSSISTGITASVPYVSRNGDS